MASEIWKPVVGYEGLYEVSSLGRIRNALGLIRRTNLCSKGYVRLGLNKANRQKHKYVHRAVMDAFVGRCPDGFEVNHINGNREDNSLSNLEYVTPAQNMAHKRITGTQQTGSRNGRSRLNEGLVPIIRQRHADGDSVLEMSKEYAVHANTIFTMLRGRTWREVT